MTVGHRDGWLTTLFQQPCRPPPVLGLDGMLDQAPRDSPELAVSHPILPPSPPLSTPPGPDDLLPKAAHILAVLHERSRGHLVPALPPTEHFALPRD